MTFTWCESEFFGLTTKIDGARANAMMRGLGFVSKKLNASYRSGPSKTWIKVKNPKAPAATRAVDGTF